MDRTAEVAKALRTVLGLMVEHPEELNIQTLPTEGGFILAVRPASGDVGKLIGAQGRTAHALRVVLNTIGKRHGQKYLLDLM